ncbi:hypothetical protein BDQ17DRAFT_1324690 [Cyathus striatus]|nr:hypothetical protein BDQ17DRAFT_1324690 [Cyathus striatus]
MSAIEREDFLSFVTSKASTTIYTVPTADIQSITQEASKHKFHAKTVFDDDAEEGFLVIGQDETAVKKVANILPNQRELCRREQALKIKEKELEEQKADVAKGGSALRVAAGGAVVGAVGTWAGLAFA